MEKGELTLRIGEEAVHFKLKTSLKQSECESPDCKTVETIVPISPKLLFGCNFHYSINENEMNFHYLDDLDCELKETVFSLNENGTEKTSNNEEETKEIETSSEGLTFKELPRQLKYAFLEPEKQKPVIISAASTELEEHKLLEIMRKYKEAIA